MSPRVSVIIPTYNRVDLLARTLSAVLDQTYPQDDFEVIVVDDGSLDGTPELLAAFAKRYPNLVYLGRSHEGPAKARNAGLSIARGSIILFTDDDCIPAKDWIEQMATHLSAHPHLLGVEGRTVSIDESITPFTHQVINLTGNLSFPTCNIAYRKQILDRVGGFDESFPYPHNEDIELAFRVLQYGEIGFNPQAEVIHPPHPMRFWQKVKQIRYELTSITLFYKHPELFRQYRFDDAQYLVGFVKYFFLRYPAYQLFRFRSWIKQNSLIYAKFCTAILCQLAYLLVLLPKLISQDRNYRSQYQHK